MSAQTKIQWTDRTWNPVRGCSVVSPGCHSCYAMKMAHRFSGPGQPYEALTKSTSAGPQWTGQVRLVEAALTEPLRWKKPQRIFVNSMSDLFHDQVPEWFILAVFVTMAKAPRHTFQILTKRAARMRALVAKWQRDGLVLREGHGAVLPNVWLGVSAEDQQRADERVPDLLDTPAAVRFVSCEPQLGPVDLSRHMPKPMFHCCGCGRELMRDQCRKCGTVDNTATNEIVGLDWVIVGGESGPKARPFDVAWTRSIVQQCKAAQVPCFVKQLGRRCIDSIGLGYSTACGGEWPCGTRAHVGETMDSPRWVQLRDRHGADPAEWPEDLRVRNFPEERS